MGQLISKKEQTSTTTATKTTRPRQLFPNSRRYPQLEREIGTSERHPVPLIPTHRDVRQRRRVSRREFSHSQDHISNGRSRSSTMSLPVGEEADTRQHIDTTSRRRRIRHYYQTSISSESSYTPEAPEPIVGRSAPQEKSQESYVVEQQDQNSRVKKFAGKAPNRRRNETSSSETI
ncbi:hypothetical protein GLAREA_04204 [Glarea lozoyensis ATCC 20868]|uniref:Uncharacterized protein n=1 Tax=Glarea lozoyensis (strain ATCC 20868 / MF5171) TaxID=1116229 RepID=S3DLI9_GLAL2|nr:uncharacterized protein GLAREA_04204 [Glarea lozoyensis ATCC 20868]EPE27413.1 hypothetical protein GLAREA_04204 [Glarea lozoyensis ATCC 20868]